MDLLLAFISSLITGIIVFLVLRNTSVPQSRFHLVNELASSHKNDLDTALALKDEKESQLLLIKQELEQYATLFSEEKQNNSKLIVLNKTLEEKTRDLENRLQAVLSDEVIQTKRINELSGELIKLESYNTTLHEKLENQQKDFKEAREKSLLEFEQIANKLFQEKTTHFSAQSKLNLEQVLNPLKENLDEFKKKVEETYDKESKQRFSLESKIKELVHLNEQISKNATDLTNALKGEAKTQGNWGEMILENILEHSGLVKNREYFIQESYRDENAKLKQPDVIIKYPGERHLVIDSKVSLTSYERFANCNNIDEQKKHLANHLKSLKQHVDNLSSKEYDKVDRSLDFVMLFVPVEPAYMTAIQYDSELWSYAYKKRILLISPTNLIASLKMVVDLWKRENQNLNAQKIAKRGEALYDKFVGFVSDMENIGSQVAKLTTTYDKAFNKLSKGKGNLLNQAEELKKLGVSSKKQIPQQYLDNEKD